MTDDPNQSILMMGQQTVTPEQEQTSDQSTPTCNVCGITARLRRCSQCKQAYYCSQLHQHTDWRTHKNLCRKINKMSQSMPVNNMIRNRTLPSGSRVQWHPAQQSVNRSSSGHLNQSLYDMNATHQVGPVPITLQDQQQHIFQAPQQPDNMKVVQQVPSYTYNETTDQISASMLENMNQLRIPGEGTSESEILSATGEAVAQLPLSSAQFLSTQTDPSSVNDKQYFKNSGTDSNDIMASDEHVHQPDMSSSSEIMDLCRTIINDLNLYGLSVLDNFLGRTKGLQILNEVHKISQAGVFRDGQVVSNPAEKDLKLIRGDKITWVRGTEKGCLSIGYLINQIDAVVTLANKMRNNGELGKFKIRERTKAMIACYPGSGAHYVMHVDNPNQDGRVITAIYYLNLNWNANMSGGALRIFPEHGKDVAYIEPIFDRIIFFWSDRRNPHEVQPSHRTRYAITVWYFDADEREKALTRYRRKKDMQHCKSTGTQQLSPNRIKTAT